MRRHALGIAALALGAAFLVTEVPAAASLGMTGAATQASYKNNGADTQAVVKKNKKKR